MSAPETRGAVQKISNEVAANDDRDLAPTPATNQLGPLTREDANALKLYEHIIAPGLKTFVNVGNAFAYIRDARLYRETHSTFDEYCWGRWNIQRNYANKLILAAQVMENLGTTVPILPTTETQARPFAILAPEEQREAWSEAVETAPLDASGAPKVTASHVRKTVERRREQSAEPSPLSVTEPSNPPRTQATVTDAVGCVVTAVQEGEADVIYRAITAAQRVLSRRRMGTSPEALADAISALLGAMVDILMVPT